MFLIIITEMKAIPIRKPKICATRSNTYVPYVTPFRSDSFGVMVTAVGFCQAAEAGIS